MKISSAVELLTSQTLPMVLRGEIERMILEGEIKPGEKVNEKRIAEHFKVSRGPVREACRTLAAEGLLKTIPNRGVVVSSLTEEEALEIYELYAIICSFASRKVATNGSKELWDTLTSLVDEMDDAVEADDFKKYFSLNLMFHETIVEGAGNSKLIISYAHTVRDLQVYRSRSIKIGKGMKQSNSEHRRILEAILSGNGDASDAAMRNHILKDRKKIMRAEYLENNQP